MDRKTKFTVGAVAAFIVAVALATFKIYLFAALCTALAVHLWSSRRKEQ